MRPEDKDKAGWIRLTKEKLVCVACGRTATRYQEKLHRIKCQCGKVMMHILHPSRQPYAIPIKTDKQIQAEAKQVKPEVKETPPDPVIPEPESEPVTEPVPDPALTPEETPEE